MTVSMYQTAVPAMARSLLALRDILEKSERHATNAGIEPKSLLGASLAPDMYDLADQVDLMCRHARGICVRLGGRDGGLFDESTCERKAVIELTGLIDHTMDLLEQVSPPEFDTSRDREIQFNIGTTHFRMTGLQYLAEFAVPNFYFHYAIAYGILRQRGVPIGKADYLGRVGLAFPRSGGVAADLLETRSDKGSSP